MKQLKTILCSLPFVLAAVGCSQDELADAATGGSGEQAQPVEITFRMGADDGIQTRSAVQRPVISSDDWQRVTDVRIYAFVSETGGDDASYYFAPGVFNDGGKDYFYVNNYAEEKKDWGDEDVWGDDAESESKDEEYTLTVKSYLKAGKHYKFLAIGRDDIDGDKHNKLENALRGEWDIDPNWDINTTLATASLKCLPDSGLACSEMFSGCSEAIHVDEYGKTYYSNIELKRIVAGMMLYVKNVPAAIKPLPESGVKPLKGNTMSVHRISICPIQYIEEVLVAQNMNADDKYPGHGMPTGNYIKNWHDKDNNNKFDYAFDKEYVSIDVSEFDGYPLKGIGSPHKDGYYYAEDGYRLLAGNFVLPQDDEPLTPMGQNDKIDKSLYLVFWTSGRDGAIMNLKSTPRITQPENSINILRDETFVPIYWIPIKISGMKDGYKFPILGNHFYSLGLYDKAKGCDVPLDLKTFLEKQEGAGGESTGGSDKPDGGSDPDEGGETTEDDDNALYITVSPDWNGWVDIPLNDNHKSE